MRSYPPLKPSCSGIGGTSDRRGPQRRPFRVPSLDNAESSLTGGFVGRVGCLVGRMLSHQVEYGRCLAVGVFLRHGAASIGRSNVGATWGLALPIALTAAASSRR